MMNHVLNHHRIAALGLAITLTVAGCAGISLSLGGFTPDPSERTPGFDVSHFQGTNIDWNAVKAGGSSFVFAKASQGISSPDKDFTQHVAGANAVDLPVGAYHFFQTGDDGVAQAEFFLKTVAGQALQLPPTLDLEGTLTQEDYKQAVAWMSHVKEVTNCQPLLYIDLSHYKALAPMIPPTQPVWLAEYSSSLPSEGLPPTLWFWQYAETGRVDGVPGDVDADWFFGSASDLSKLRCGALDAVG